ncbi:hypothetical protein CB0940_03526 [Cercospora beticola]|uniref:Thioredoxin domain-containing protein n=1 Tax=Cercospora beticola TaxID=122368 RepID=A0A2G5I5V0_CERBT|nr:hypothetical protein CB0940_03526 [Cercospora beticola]PIB00139.1 hypothetical protein CB0940_03526 [Cercospora beticola]WPB00700.1 hypothetical protein RHO25_005320 [Cercospora beticola]CAK1361063.1 unnamed protein product [Cercospora beticola]
MATAAERALNVAELLERILLSLPMKDILLDQRVSKFWKELVKNSPKLQQALFYRPDYDTETWTAIDWYEIEYVSGALVLEAVGPQVNKDAESSDWHRQVVMGRANELLLHYRRDSECVVPENGSFTFLIQDSDREGLDPFVDGYSPISMDEDEDSSIIAALRNKKPTDKNFKPSWCGMFLSQPPVTELQFTNWFSEDSTFENGDFKNCKNAKGVTADDLIEAMFEAYGNWKFPDVHGQRLYIWDPIVAPQMYFKPDEGVRDFKRLEDLTGSRSNALDLCKQMDHNLWTMKYGDQFDRLVKYGLLKEITPDIHVEDFLIQKEHLPD